MRGASRIVSEAKSIIRCLCRFKYLIALVTPHPPPFGDTNSRQRKLTLSHTLEGRTIKLAESMIRAGSFSHAASARQLPPGGNQKVRRLFGCRCRFFFSFFSRPARAGHFTPSEARHFTARRQAGNFTRAAARISLRAPSGAKPTPLIRFFRRHKINCRRKNHLLPRKGRQGRGDHSSTAVVSKCLSLIVVVAF